MRECSFSSTARDFTKWTATLTFGGEDITHCAAGTYRYAPLLDAGTDSDVAIASISLLGDDGSPSATIPMNGTVHVSIGPDPYPIGVTRSVFELVVNATGL